MAVLIELRAIFSGRVQGVGFRYRIVELAEQLSLKGEVKNLRDGSVELRAVGSRSDLEKFLQTLKAHPGRAQIESIKKEFLMTPSHYTSFNISFD